MKPGHLQNVQKLRADTPAIAIHTSSSGGDLMPSPLFNSFLPPTVSFTHSTEVSSVQPSTEEKIPPHTSSPPHPGSMASPLSTPQSSLSVESLLLAARMVSKKPQTVVNECQRDTNSLHPPLASNDGGGSSNISDVEDEEYKNITSPLLGILNITKNASSCYNTGDSVKSTTRKSKSLSVLCKKFLDMYIDQRDSQHIKVDELSMALGVERRRIYDIMNIFMAIFIISKKGKNCYLWHGLFNLRENIKRLRGLTVNSNQSSLTLSRCLSVDGNHTRTKDLDSSFLHSTSLGIIRTGSIDYLKKEKSLEVLTQQFLVLLMRRKVICMDEIARDLIDSTDRSSSNFNTKIRRLYDIANVLSTLKMVERVKVETPGGRKLAFRWLGVKGVQRCISERSFSSENIPEVVESTQPCSNDSGLSNQSPPPTTTNNPPPLPPPIIQSKEVQLELDLIKVIKSNPWHWKMLLDPNYVLTVAKKAGSQQMENLHNPATSSFIHSRSSNRSCGHPIGNKTE